MRIAYPPQLPVSSRRDDIAAAMRDHQVVIVAGATGSGKTTQLPKIALELGRERIGHTQPRRLAARTIAERLAEELEVGLGAEVGYKVRFTDEVSKATKIKVMTDGVLLAEMHRDKLLSRYDTIIIDEAHERSLTIDFLIGYLKRLLPKRPDLKVIITSATIDPESFSKHFDDAPIIEVSGRTFPVEIRYRPLVNEVEGDAHGDIDAIDGVEAAIREIMRDDDGDILVFFSGEAEIRDAQDALRGRLGERVELLPLYGRLSAAEQHRVFEASTRAGVARRVVLATNVAETSLTVPGIRHVIDTGTARISRYSTRSKVQRLPIEAISKASANQRSGRAGRVADGIAIRLYSEEDFQRRDEFTDPEIMRTNLASVILQAATLGIGALERFPFLQLPDARGLKDGHELLRELGAITADGGVTKIGRELATLPVDPRFGRMVLAGRDAQVAHETVAIVAALSIQDPRERPLEKRERADELHKRFTDPTSDFLTLLNLWRHLLRRQSELSGNAFRREAKAEFLNVMRIREWQDVVRQLSRALRLPKGAVGESADADAIHKALLTGLLGHIGIRDADTKKADARHQRAGARGKPPREYRGARGSRFKIHPASALAKQPPEALMAAELVETSQLFARTVAKIDPEWAEPLAGANAKRSISEPHWEQKQGAAVAYERVTLFGVPIIERRRVQFARYDAEHARELFIRHALVESEWDSQQEFDRKNRQLRRELERLEERQRRRDLLVSDDAVYDFYDARIPKEVVSTRSFEGWWRATKRESPQLLTMQRSDLLEREEAPDSREYPTKWQQGEQRLRLTYRFSPGDAEDGVSVHVPIAVLPRLSPVGFDWLVPGMREELLTAMIKALPKQIRKHVVPAGDWARAMLQELPAEPGEVSLAEALADRIRRKHHVAAEASDVDVARIPAHLRPTFVVEDARGRRLGSGKDLPQLQAKHAGQATKQVAKVAERVTSELERDESAIDTDLPDHVDVRQGHNTVRAYPGYAVTGSGEAGPRVGIRLAATAEARDAAQREAVKAKLLSLIATPAAHITEHLTAAEKLALGSSPYRSTNALLADVLAAIIDAEYAAASEPATPAGFAAMRAQVEQGIVERMFATVAQVARALTAARGADKAIREGASIALMAQLGDARASLDALIFDGFVRATGLAQLERLPVYVQAIEYRVKRLPETAHRDRVWMAEVETALALYREAGGEVPLPLNASERLRTAWWQLEELRVSLYAQQLGARGPISVQRIRKTLAG